MARIIVAELLLPHYDGFAAALSSPLDGKRRRRSSPSAAGCKSSCCREASETDEKEGLHGPFDWPNLLLWRVSQTEVALEVGLHNSSFLSKFLSF